eukprot:gnl/TRDRNA2_/TRDRNA2_138768_c1_seq2.p1 gnl/TRDRNA2_/TRDRNA2_138768_c1~~gnl/TRDRNA2_/TRDRNA2_138768_c1_seq2.p1  ORF type:complete len:102 (+),score=8.01 gnl/TRDRNA2_/TRDRNA2_138768_c1_seq2:215-520(+)
MCRRLQPIRHIEIGYTEENPFTGNKTLTETFWNQTCGSCNVALASDWQVSDLDDLSSYSVAGLLCMLLTCVFVASFSLRLSTCLNHCRAVHHVVQNFECEI